LLLQGVDFVCQSLGLARQAPARQCAPVANLRNILWLPAHSTYCFTKSWPALEDFSSPSNSLPLRRRGLKHL
jgi:hypothetical protein